MSFLPKAQPVAALRDVYDLIRAPTRERLVIFGISLTITLLIIGAFLHDFTYKKIYHAPEVFYVKQWPKSRTLAQIKQQQAIDGPKERAAAAQDAADEKAATAKRIAEFKRLNEEMKHFGFN